MAKRSRGKRQRQVERQRTQRRQRAWRVPAMWAGSIAAVVFVGFFVVGLGGKGVPASPETLAIAGRIGTGSVSIYRGSAHTVYHSEQPLPTRAAPSSDERPTLVWFSGTWCPFCERMEPWIWEAASGFSSEIVFVEKSIDHDKNAARAYGIRGSPIFVLIDGSGNEIARFGYVANAGDFARAVEAVLARTGT